MTLPWKAEDAHKTVQQNVPEALVMGCMRNMTAATAKYGIFVATNPIFAQGERVAATPRILGRATSCGRKSFVSKDDASDVSEQHGSQSG